MMETSVASRELHPHTNFLPGITVETKKAKLLKNNSSNSNRKQPILVNKTRENEESTTAKKENMMKAMGSPNEIDSKSEKKRNARQYNHRHARKR
jgi:hypothetical protein